MPISDQGLASQKVPEPIVAGAAVARGRVYFVSSDGLYAIGPKKTAAKPWQSVTPTMEPGQGAPTWVQVAPTEMVLNPGDTVQLQARLYDAQGRLLNLSRDSKGADKAEWSLQGLKGTITDGKLTIAPDKTGQAGLIKVKLGSLNGEARARVRDDVDRICEKWGRAAAD